jgi:hypothetical protein
MLRVVAALACLTLAAPAQAAKGLPDKDDAAVRSLAAGLYRDAAAGDWAGYAKRMHPAALKAFRDDFAAVLTAAAKDGRADDLVALFDGARDLKAVLAYPPDEFLARLMKGTAQAAPGPVAGRAQVVGAVAEGADQAHVVVRVTHKLPGTDRAVSAVEVVSVRRTDRGWGAEVPKELAVVASTLRATGGVATQQKTEVIPPDPPKQ